MNLDDHRTFRIDDLYNKTKEKKNRLSSIYTPLGTQSKILPKISVMIFTILKFCTKARTFRKSKGPKKCPKCTKMYQNSHKIPRVPKLPIFKVPRILHKWYSVQTLSYQEICLILSFIVMYKRELNL